MGEACGGPGGAAGGLFSAGVRRGGGLAGAGAICDWLGELCRDGSGAKRPPMAGCDREGREGSGSLGGASFPGSGSPRAWARRESSSSCWISFGALLPTSVGARRVAFANSGSSTSATHVDPLARHTMQSRSTAPVRTIANSSFFGNGPIMSPLGVEAYHSLMLPLIRRFSGGRQHRRRGPGFTEGPAACTLRVVPLSRLSTIALLLVLGCSDSSQGSSGASGGSVGVAGADGQGGSGQGGSGQGGSGLGGATSGGASQGGSSAGGAAGAGDCPWPATGAPSCAIARSTTWRIRRPTIPCRTVMPVGSYRTNDTG